MENTKNMTQEQEAKQLMFAFMDTVEYQNGQTVKIGDWNTTPVTYDDPDE